MHVVHLEDRRGRSKGFPLGPGFLLDGGPGRPHPAQAAARAQLAAARQAASRTASGSRAVHGARARVASGSRIFVEGRHDAELVEKVWGDDLRIEGVVVEMLDGVDDLAAAIRDFQPGPRPAHGRARGPPRARAPRSTGSCRPPSASRRMPRTCGSWGTPTSTCGSRCARSGWGCSRGRSSPAGSRGSTASAPHLGWPHDTQADIARAWKRILGTVRTYADLEPTLLASVEELIDFVTEPGA